MTDWNILVADQLDEGGLAIIERSARVDYRPEITSAEILKIIGNYDGLIVRGRTRVTAELLAAAVRLRVVGRAGVGVDNIDLDAACRCGVIVVNAPASTTTAVAELTLGLLLALARRIPCADASMKHGEWVKKGFVGGELAQKTLGIIGLGRIGSAVARRAAAFEMTVLGCEPILDREKAARCGAQAVPLEQLLSDSDYISIHTPLTEETRGMINAAAFARMKPGVRLVCTARGGIVDESALLQALESGRVAGAALDVFMLEPPADLALIAHPDVIATPHIGAQTVEAQARAGEDIAHEVIAALQGTRLRWRV